MFWKICKAMVVVFLTIIMALMIALAVFVKTSKVVRDARQMPLPKKITAINASSDFYDRDGKYLKSSTRNIYMPLDSMSQYVPLSFMAAEDPTFYSHHGINYKRALMGWVIRPLLRKEPQGASTITMQLARNLFLTREKTWQRKLKEIILAWRMERAYTKKDILEVYLNIAHFGVGVEGVEGASRYFLGKSSSKLNLNDASLLASVLSQPVELNPRRHPGAARWKQELNLRRMLNNRAISQIEYDKALSAPVITQPSAEITREADFYVRLAWGNLPEDVRSTTKQKIGLAINRRFQKSLQTAVEIGLGPTYRALGLKPYNVKMSRAEKDKYPQGAAAAMDTRTGELLAMVGSSDLINNFELDLATAKNQIGSTAKIVPYGRAILQGFLPNTIFCDSPVRVLMPYGQPEWSPKNFGGHHRGPTTLTDGLRRSLNLIAVRAMFGDTTCAELLSSLNNTQPDSLAALGKQLGLNLKPLPSAAIGASEASVLDVLYAYATLATGGIYRQPRLVNKINGQLVPYDSTSSHIVFTPQEAYILLSMFMNTLRTEGTAEGFYGKVGFEFPAAAKTGTTNDSRDCWFVVFTPEIVVAVWVGYDDNRPLRNGTGSSAAMPIAAEFIKRVAGQLQFPDWTMPSGVELKKFNSTTGRIKSPDEPPEETDLEAVFPIAASENKN